MSDVPTPADDLAALLARRALTEDAARPDAVAKRHAQGGRTARENVEDLVDPGSWVEYGRFAIAAQRARRELDELIGSTPPDPPDPPPPARSPGRGRRSVAAPARWRSSPTTTRSWPARRA